MLPSVDGAPPPALLKAVRRLLRPLVRMLLSHQVTYPYLSNLLKSVYVEVADRDFALPGRSQTISRISLLTGVHRKDVKRLRDEESEHDPIPSTVSLGAQVVARWTGLAEYCGADGQPLPLPRQASSGLSFESLVESVSKDIRPRAVLDEWLRLGLARVEEADDGERVLLEVDAFVPDSGFDEKAFYLGRNLRDHIATAAHNLAGREPSRLERSVYYDELTQESLRELAELSETRAMEALQAVNRRALALQAQDADRSGAQHRMNFGVYFNQGPMEEAALTPEDDGSDSQAASREHD